MKKSLISWLLPLVLSKVAKGSKTGQTPMFNQLFLFMAMRKMLPLPFLVVLFFRKPLLDKVLSFLKKSNSKAKV